ncbi:MAG TPA: glycosyltransferase family 4 protein [Verrucomicrobiae bacterium]|jgi:glycosyltransferase involved in cell wall biosynthesis|nr:glycosyltransferase family 4 protein [Verrucomicrobiae bacterium]
MPKDGPLRIVQLTPGAGKMYCGACLRDNALVAALRKNGHSVVMAPLYLPMTLDEDDQSSGTPLFYSGINVYLDQESPLFRKAPQWLHRLLASPSLLKLASGAAANTQARELGELTISMLRGEEGNQARELDDLVRWLRVEKPDVVCLSNVLLAGMARRIRREVGVPVICSLQGEDYFLDALPEAHRKTAWETTAERAADIDLFIAPSRYFADLMSQRLRIPASRMRILANGISLEGYDAPTPKGDGTPVLGFFARMCRDKGLDQLVEAYLYLKKRDGLRNLKLRVGGSCGPSDQPLVDSLRSKLHEQGHSADVDFRPNLSRAEKLDFLRSLSVLSVPAAWKEAFGLYIIESLAAGVPVVQPNQGAFPELIASTGGGVLYAAEDETGLADTLEKLLLAPERAREMGRAGRAIVVEKYGAETMAREMARICQELCGRYFLGGGTM